LPNQGMKIDNLRTKEAWLKPIFIVYKLSHPLNQQRRKDL
jgi:hypothetical protein